ncbi:MAG: hypothetical protein J6A69_09525 [Clostridia bacterium]|nr:hypothetical protein [Clostridia bacterium]
MNQTYMVAVIFAITCVIMIAMILKKPTLHIVKKDFSSYWVVALLGAFTMLLFSNITPTYAINSMLSSGSVNPIKILVLFISMTSISVFLDETGFFKYLAVKTLKLAGNSQYKLFLMLYITVSVLTVFTSNDIIILTFTPFICHFAKNANISPVPYLTLEFTAANTWSMFLIIGNPTNIYLASYFNTDFASYTKIMALPTVLAGVTAFGIILLLFKKDLKKKAEISDVKAIEINKPLMIMGLFILSACTVLLAIASYIELEMWIISFLCAVLLFTVVAVFCRIHHDKSHIISNTMHRMPWQLIPFVLSMFVMVIALDFNHVTEFIAGFLANLPMPALTYTLSSALFANFVNNIPMSVLFCSVSQSSGLGQLAEYASIIGSNVGALITPVGALAGIMWADILNGLGIKYTFKSFVKNGTLIAIPTLVAAAFGLNFVF